MLLKDKRQKYKDKRKKKKVEERSDEIPRSGRESGKEKVEE